MINVWVVTGNTESGDDFGPEVFTKKPSAAVLKKLVFEFDGDEEIADGPGYAGSYVHLKVTKVLVR